jgi:hypothetical protein
MNTVIQLEKAQLVLDTAIGYYQKNNEGKNAKVFHILLETLPEKY